jgi:hypothetical protein
MPKHNERLQDESHQRATELHEGAEHAHTVGATHGKQDHLTPAELSRQETESAPEIHDHHHPSTHGIIPFGHREIAALAFELWQARGCPVGSPDEDWFHAVEELRARSFGH